MCGDDQTVFGEIENHFDELFCRKPEDRSSIRGELTKAPQSRADGLHHFEARSENEIMDASPPAPLSEDVTHLGGQDETNSLISLSQLEKTLACRNQCRLQLRIIRRMGKISCPEETDPLLLGPPGERLHLHILACPTAELRMEMKISNEPHRKPKFRRLRFRVRVRVRVRLR